VLPLDSDRQNSPGWQVFATLGSQVWPAGVEPLGTQMPNWLSKLTQVPELQSALAWQSEAIHAGAGLASEPIFQQYSALAQPVAESVSVHLGRHSPPPSPSPAHQKLSWSLSDGSHACPFCVQVGSVASGTQVPASQCIPVAHAGVHVFGLLVSSSPLSGGVMTVSGSSSGPVSSGPVSTGSMVVSGEPLLPLLPSRMAASHTPILVLHVSVGAHWESLVHAGSASLDAQPTCTQLRAKTTPNTNHQVFPSRFINVLETIKNVVLCNSGRHLQCSFAACQTPRCSPRY
jgi:hypothetical protein